MSIELIVGPDEGDGVGAPDRCATCNSGDRVTDAHGGYLRHPWWLCHECLCREGERAHERSLENYYGGDGPLSINEQCAEALAIKRGLRT